MTGNNSQFKVTGTLASPKVTRFLLARLNIGPSAYRRIAKSELLNLTEVALTIPPKECIIVMVSRLDLIVRGSGL
jgi:hypothetical protein